jgi:hypothetical protein
MAAAAVAFASTPPALADDLVGTWEGEYFCNQPNPVGRLKLTIARVDGKLVGHESFTRGNNSGTVIYNVEPVGSDYFRLRVDQTRTRDVSFPYHLEYQVWPDLSLKGTYVGHRNCHRTQLTAVASDPGVVSIPPTDKEVAATAKSAPTPQEEKAVGVSPDWKMLDANEKQAWGEMLKDCGAGAAQSALPQCLIKMVGLQTKYQATMSVRFLESVADSLIDNRAASCWVLNKYANEDIALINRRTGARFQDLTTCEQASALFEGTYGTKPRWQDCRDFASYETYAVCMKTYFGTPEEEAALRKIPDWAGARQVDNPMHRLISSYFSSRNEGVADALEPILESRRKRIADFKDEAINNAKLCERDGELGGNGFQQLANVVVQAAQTEYTPLRGNYASCDFIRKFSHETGLIDPAGKEPQPVIVTVPDAQLLDLADAASARFKDYRYVALEEVDGFNLYATLPDPCSSVFVDVRKRYPDIAAVTQAVLTDYTGSIQHLVDLAYECRRSGGVKNFEVSYFGQPLFTVREGKVATTLATARWNANELPDAANFNVLLDGLNYRGATTQEKRANMVRAIMLGSRGAGYALAYTYGREEYVTTFGYAVAEKAPREKAVRYIAAFAMSLARGYREAERKAAYLPAIDLAMAGDWAMANPRANPLEVTDAALRAAMTAETAQAIRQPTGQEILEALGGYFSGHCSYAGMLAHGRFQRGAPPAPPIDASWTPGQGSCSASWFGIKLFTLSPMSVHRESCQAGTATDSYDCKITFRWRCDGDGFGSDVNCKIIEGFTSPGQISLVDDPDKQGRGWKAVKLVYDGEFKEPPPQAVRDRSPCDDFRGIALTSRMRTALALGGCW